MNITEEMVFDTLNMFGFLAVELTLLFLGELHNDIHETVRYDVILFNACDSLTLTQFERILHLSVLRAWCFRKRGPYP